MAKDCMHAASFQAFSEERTGSDMHVWKTHDLYKGFSWSRRKSSEGSQPEAAAASNGSAAAAADQAASTRNLHAELVVVAEPSKSEKDRHGLALNSLSQLVEDVSSGFFKRFPLSSRQVLAEVSAGPARRRP
mmetsp:Transcript_54511/g.112487  ORF Transcript_54511/g.112487 Transcript_54511/m.112487 type:complete len:132 (-) Transcript_54511:1048-1443(-)